MRIAVIIAIVALAGTAAAQVPAEQGKAPTIVTREAATFGGANRSYVEGRFDEAIKRYEALVSAGVVHEDLYYNLGNAYFRAGRIGPAIYNFERALRIDPGMEDARFNMEVAREAVAERVVDRLKGAESEAWWVRMATFFSVSQLTIGLLALDALFFALLIAVRFIHTGFLRTALMASASFVLVALLGTFVLLNRHVHVLEEVYQGIVIADQVVMREDADNRSAEKGTPLHPGVRVSLRGRDAGWLRIRLANGMEGWVPESAIGQL
jgi:tetratricopeptide (TPR) repeat protein